MAEDIIKIANKIEGLRNKPRHHSPYNVFTAWGMSENDHTKLLLALLRYQNQTGRYPLLNSFLNRFTKGRGKMIHYQNPSDVIIRFSPRNDKDAKHSFIDGLITFSAQGKRIAIIIENKIFDAPDQNGQIRRYITHMTEEEHIALDNVWVLYITGTGTKEIDECSYRPDNEDEATNIGRRFVSLTYYEDIIEWLKQDILDLRIYPESLTSIVRAYVEALEKDILCEDQSDTWRKDMLCNTLTGPGHRNMDKMTDCDFNRLYSFRDAVQEVRKEMANKDEKDIIAIDNLYGVIRDLIHDVEQKFFGEFERISSEILNVFWKRELKKLKGVQWIARHRGLHSNKGFVQIGLSTEWGTAHLEWNPISAKSMCLGNEYQLELHVENDKILADKWREDLNRNAILLPVGSIKKVTSRLLRYKYQTSKPIAKMSNKELTKFLTKVYTQDLNFCCRMLVEHFHDYN
ncbi:MAG: PD-(D/E)XK nuclease family protein [Bacteroidaceae bacterium]|nr:PD-(D/E)XK nuclease family protein [Bacteroidaceae bacterium]